MTDYEIPSVTLTIGIFIVSIIALCIKTSLISLETVAGEGSAFHCFRALMVSMYADNRWNCC